MSLVRINSPFTMSASFVETITFNSELNTAGTTFHPTLFSSTLNRSITVWSWYTMCLKPAKVCATNPFFMKLTSITSEPISYSSKSPL
ncbi:hypothetical protein OGAPHI_000727 [Ogataea philodendri]|uniref:Uncharacterized protein n=1 Tax=Ogataea philodendri TaxID=1378263 RepID=A0A9P8TAE2_9ASCO|nr:uncharacterized protein OGAPHI_000727 [Ogataea philodendri]KAH3671016.1 hypothetical protein OGAPHI_000727 [Ogataea philodendri]